MSREKKEHEAMNKVYAAELFADVRTAYTAGDVRKTYGMFSRLLSRMLDGVLADTQVHFCGTFAKLDYVLKERKASTEMYAWANDTRARINRANRGMAGEKDMQKSLPIDFKALCTLTAYLYDVAVPAECAALFTAEGTRLKARKRLLDRQTQYIRMVADGIDDNYIYGRAEAEGMGEVRVCYSNGNENYDYDRSYLKEIVGRGTQLNLIRPRVKDDTLYPELIIYEPDLLIDISAVTGCFSAYTDSPMLYVLNKLRPNEQTWHTILGNFASQMLDERLRNSDSDLKYADSATAFMRNNPSALLTTDLPPDFHKAAARQKANIDKAICNDLPRLRDDYNAEEVVLEPSFFSEMLGLQGRMDFLQMDSSILIEQKSGRCGFPQRDPDMPVPDNKHYMQMLLYMALIRYNHRDLYERNGRRMQAMLLYSKYKEALLPLGFAPRLLFDALRMRNLMAYTERDMARNGAEKLLHITADGLNTKGTGGRLWMQYQRPELEMLLGRIHRATPTERAYVLRFMAFVEREHLLAKYGTEGKEGSGFAAKWHNTTEEKLLAGNICCGLVLDSPSETHEGCVEEVRLRFPEADSYDPGTSNFRPGDIAVLFPYRTGTTPDIRQAVVHRCTITSISGEGIVLKLRAAQSNVRAFTKYAHEQWAVEHDMLEASYTAQHRALYSLLCAPKERRDLLMMQRPPRTDNSLRLNGDYGSFDTLVLRAKQARDMFFIVGPPGTGKTSFGLVNILNEELTTPESAVLLLSFTNRAVDEICSKLAEQHTPYIRVGSELSCAPPYRQRLLSSLAGEAADLNTLRSLLTGCRVVVATTSAMNAASALLRIKRFSLCIIDEASQILEPQLIGLLSASDGEQPFIQRFVMIGDHKQLPAVVQQSVEESRVNNKILRDIMLEDCRLSLFERMLKRYGGDKRMYYMLDRQGRMHPDIARFPNEEFYEGRLLPVPLPHQQESLHTPPSTGNKLFDALDSHRVVFADVRPTEDDASDKVNTAEADTIARILRYVYYTIPHFDPDTSAGVIVPYRNQITTVRRAIERMGIEPLTNIAIDTVERYQGSQRDCIVYGFTVRKRYQLDFLSENSFTENGHTIDRKLNVAMTRARKRLIMVGNTSLLRHNTVFARLIKHVSDEGGMVDVSE